MKWKNKYLNIKKEHSVRLKIIESLFIFIAIIILVLWLFQVFFLENFYVFIKTRSVKAAASEINEVIYSSDYKSSIDAIIKENEFCVNVYANSTDIPIYSSSGKGDPRCTISEFSMTQYETEIKTLQQKAISNGGSASELFNTREQTKNIVKFEKQLGLDNRFSIYGSFSTRNEIPKVYEGRRGTQTMTYVSVVIGEDQTMRTIVVNAQLTPVNATVDTIQTQFIIIVVILVIVALILAYYLSKRIARPIIKINESAKILATGQYDVTFNGIGYLEADELSATLNYAAKELSKVDNLRKELIANMSHDLRTPLTMISGYGEVMRDIPGENTAENVQIIIEEAKRLTNLVNDMLDLSKLQAGVQELNSKTFDLTQEVENIIARYDKLLTSKECNIKFKYKEHVYVHADVIKIGQVIYNLINNAINYCGEDHLVLVHQTVENHSVRIDIIDHGPGIEKDQLPYIWERYYKVDKTHIRSKVGSGLGLSIVRSVLELHKAKYGVKSTIGKGTNFWFTLPVRKEKH